MATYSINLTRETSQTDDNTFSVLQGDFIGNDQSIGTRLLRSRFDPIDDRFTAFHYGKIIRSIIIGSFGWEKIVIVLADGFFFTSNATIFTTSTIQSDEPAFTILKEKRNFRQ